MFVGHFALAFAAKPHAPQVSLPVLFAAAQFAGLLWPVLVAAGIEQVRVAPGITAFTPLDFVSVYARATRPPDATGRQALVGVAVFLAAGFVVTALGPPPPSVETVWMGALVLMLVTLGLARWVERHRVTQ